MVDAPMKFTSVFWHNVDAVSKFRYITNKGGSRSSKTYSIMQLLWMKLDRTSGLVVVMGALTRSIVLKNIVKPLSEIAGSQWKVKNFNKTDMTYTMPNGSLIYFISMDSEDKVVGLESDYVFLDEANLSPYAGEIVMQLATRMAKVMFLAFNPSRRPEWLEEIEKREDNIIIHSTYKDNEFLDDNVINEIETRSKTDAVYAKVYRDGEYALDVKEAIFNDWSVGEWPEVDFEWFGYSIDWGFSRDQTAMVVGGLYQGNIYVKQILYKIGLTESEILHELKKVGYHLISCDNSEPRMISNLQNMGVRLLPTKKYAGSILDGIRAMQSLPIIIDEESTDLIREFQDYRWKKIKGLLIDKPADRQADHLIDAFRYLVMDKLNINNGKYIYS